MAIFDVISGLAKAVSIPDLPCYQAEAKSF